MYVTKLVNYIFRNNLALKCMKIWHKKINYLFGSEKKIANDWNSEPRLHG